MTVVTLVSAIALAINTVTFAAVKAPPSNFITNSWNQMNAATRYHLVCGSSAGPATALSALSTTIQQNFDLLQLALARFGVDEQGSVILGEQKLEALKQKTNALDAVILFAQGSITYDQAVQQIQAVAMKAGHLIIVKTAVAFADQNKVWSQYTDKEMTAIIFKGMKGQKATTSYNKASMKFSKWEGSDPVYAGKLTQSATDSLVNATIGEAFKGTAAIGDVKILIDGKTKLWKKIVTTLNVQLGAIAFPVTQTCNLTYGKTVDVKIPANATQVDLTTGRQGVGQITQ